MTWLFVLVAACGGGSTTTESESRGGGGPAEGSSGGEGAPDFEGRLINLAMGFVPDPRVVEGRAAGAIDASTLGADCVGFLGTEPDHQIVLGEALEQLHVMATSPLDVTLVIRLPDQTVICNDDFQETNPKLSFVPAPAGTYQVWVGNYEEGGTPSPYHLGVTTLATVMPSMLVPGEEEEPLDLGEGEGEGEVDGL